MARPSVADRIVTNSRVEGSDCWTWQLGLTVDGYGFISVKGRKIPAHRASYEALVGAIPDGMVIDHLCRNRACVNPAHLEPVTRDENQARGLRSHTKTHCVHGHEFTPENTYINPRGRGFRQCRTCTAIYQRRYQSRLRGQDS